MNSLLALFNRASAKCGFVVLTLSVLAGFPARSQSLEEERFVEYRSRPSLVLQDTRWDFTARDLEHDFDQVPGTLTFNLAQSSALFSGQRTVGGVPVYKLKNDPEERMLSPKFDLKIAFVRAGDKTYAKFEESGSHGDDGSMPYSVSGSYEMTLTGGSWADYEDFGTVSFQIAKADRDRYVSDQLNKLQVPAMLESHRQKYKGMLVEFVEKAPEILNSNPALAAEVAAKKEVILRSTVTATPSLETSFATYTLDGEFLLAECARRRESVVCKAILTPEAAAADNWRERAGMQGTPDRFDPKDHRTVDSPFKNMHKLGVPQRRGE